MNGKIALTFALSLLITGCGRFSGSPHNMQGEQGSSTDNDNHKDPGTQDPPITGNQTVVAVAVGVGGRIVSGSEGFSKILLDTQAFTPETQAAVQYDTAGKAVSCPAGSGLSLMPAYSSILCCYAPGECVGGGYHSDFLFRAIAFGNGRFVAVGGFGTGFSEVSTDGVHWSKRNSIDEASGTLTGRKGTGWIGGIAFGNGVFVAADGGPIVSTDGLHWTSKMTTPSPVGGIRELFFLGDHFYASGDNGVWAITKDGSTWDSYGSSPTGLVFTDVKRQGDTMYGIVSHGNLYKASATDGGANWTLVPTNDVNYFVHLIIDPITHAFTLFNGGKLLTAPDPDGVWTDTTSTAPGGSVASVGGYLMSFYGDGGMQSPDGGKTWIKFPTGSGNKQPILKMAAGIVQTP